MKNEIVSVIEKYREEYRKEFGMSEGMPNDDVDAPYSFIEKIYSSLGVSVDVARSLNYVANCEMGRC